MNKKLIRKLAVLQAIRENKISKRIVDINAKKIRDYMLNHSDVELKQILGA